MTYLDHAATTPMRQCAVDAWAEHAAAVNPGSQYSSGRRANAVLQEAREQIAALLGADPVEVVFTGSGTEADNIAVRGLFRASVAAGRPARVVTSTVEHPAVTEAVNALVHQDGAEVDWLEVGRDGHVQELTPLDAPAAVASLMWANNETGAVQPVKEAAQRAAAAGTPFHVDAVQVVGKIPVDFHALGATTLAASAHKFGGPRGAGLLLAKRSPAPQPLIVGGGQERGIRSGTVDVAAAAATAAALAEAVAEMEKVNARVSALRSNLVHGVRAAIDDVIVTTQQPALDGHAHFMFPGANADAMVMLLDQQGFEASAGSACASGVVRISHVLEVMGYTDHEAMGALRVTLGRTTTDDDVRAFLAVLPEVVEKARAAGAM
ncbi:cysteine desulfurase family protein [Corynebacterium sp. Q4381]|uniref:cysteine desulfurase family protein n=1 Tax=Corynebacterium sp. Marseille-Q4381 TaxID=3121597 RepID=UPI002FE5259D